VAAAGAGVDHRLSYRGLRSRLRGDRSHQAHARSGAVPGSPGCLADNIHVGGAGDLWRVFLPARVERLIVAGHIAVGACVRIPLGVFPLPVADRISEHVADPVPDALRVRIRVGLSQHILVDTCVFGPARSHADEHGTVRSGIGFYAVGRPDCPTGILTGIRQLMGVLTWV
jgi:hypothetical protein